MELDLRMLLSVALSAAVMAVVFHFQARSFPLTIRGIQRWGWAFLALSMAFLLAASREFLPTFFSVLLSSVGIHAALALFYFGTCQFMSRTPHYSLMAVPIGLNLLAQVYFLYGDPLLWARVAANGASNFLILLPTLYLVLKGREGDPVWRFSKLYSATFVSVIGLVCLLRGGWALVHQPLAAPQVPVAMGQVLVVFYPTIVMVVATGFVLLAFDRLKDELEYLVSHDALTGAFSRRGFLSLAEAEISRALRMQRHTALLVLDLDYFKQVNDRFGHPAGDQVLCKFADVAKTCLRREDLFGRFGGEEFMVLLPDTLPDAARVVAERIRSAVSASRVSLPAADHQIRFTVSIGIANAAGRGTLEELLKLADNAMYLAKSRGRNRVEVA